MAPNSSKSVKCNKVKSSSGCAASGGSKSGVPPTKAAAAAPPPSAPYFCCKGRQFHLYSGLLRHIKAEHRSKPLFYCEPCRLCVTTEYAIKRHREVVHEGRVRFLCAVCMAADYNRPAILKHLDKKHADLEDRMRQDKVAHNEIHIHLEFFLILNMKVSRRSRARVARVL